eukprot:GFUD01076782.1.p1 GENE.GFUD01076782.1~~GFUD01076782.1.p1  ORF type:complete len:260 (+),score=58.22 GFUD01076782.1:37-816(+)
MEINCLFLLLLIVPHDLSRDSNYRPPSDGYVEFEACPDEGQLEKCQQKCEDKKYTFCNFKGEYAGCFPYWYWYCCNDPEKNEQNCEVTPYTGYNGAHSTPSCNTDRYGDWRFVKNTRGGHSTCKREDEKLNGGVKQWFNSYNGENVEYKVCKKPSYWCRNCVYTENKETKYSWSCLAQDDTCYEQIEASKENVVIICSVVGGTVFILITSIAIIILCKRRKGKKENKEVEIFDPNFYYGDDGGDDYQETKFVDNNEYYD